MASVDEQHRPGLGLQEENPTVEDPSHQEELLASVANAP